ncbi:Transcription elongation factor GreA [Candidatus Xenohaliotis californiensis]|uniref:Transcription elongation factor GreA n=1 Tax=Candidatus Xenohaliotis californiensis TaxID=84677 RepID=A0ABM9N8H9_9RICK|nr:Transcription elongation factor GreA [Candidatus Xenohaliotis californiensis]
MPNPMTTNGYEELLRRLDEYKSQRRPIAEEIAEARSKGDLSENAEYHAAKAKQEMLERKIAEIGSIASDAEVIDVATIESDNIVFGATVSLREVDSGKRHIYKLVGQMEADVSNGLISIDAALSREVLGKKVGDIVCVSLPAGERLYEIENIKYE